MGPLRNANATMVLASAANSGSNVVLRLGIGVSQTRNHTHTNGWDRQRYPQPRSTVAVRLSPHMLQKQELKIRAGPPRSALGPISGVKFGFKPGRFFRASSAHPMFLLSTSSHIPASSNLPCRSRIPKLLNFLADGIEVFLNSIIPLLQLLSRQFFLVRFGHNETSLLRCVGQFRPNTTGPNCLVHDFVPFSAKPFPWVRLWSISVGIKKDGIIRTRFAAKLLAECGYLLFNRLTAFLVEPYFLMRHRLMILEDSPSASLPFKKH